MTETGVVGDGVTTSTGMISGIDTNASSSFSLSFEWNAAVDIPNTQTSSVYIKITPNDGTTDGTAVSSTAFAVDTNAPSAPGNLSVSATTTRSVTLKFGTASSEPNFREYKIFYKAGSSGVGTSDTAFTSTSDSNLGLINYNAAATTTISGLATSTQYVFNIWAYDNFRNTPAVAEITFYTLANTPSAPTLSNPTTTTLNVAITSGDTNSTSVEYAIFETSSTNYVQANGTLGASIVWATKSGWGTKTVTGFATNTAHQFSAIARNGDGVLTNTSTQSATVYTLAVQTSAPTIGTATSSTLPITINVTDNSSSTTYAIYDATNNNYLAATGATSVSAVWQTTSTWGSTFAAINLATNTIHQFTVVARNGDSVQAATSTASTAKYTLAVQAGAPIIGTTTSTTIPITIAANGNSSSTTYALYNATVARFLDSAGVATTTPVWQTTSTWTSSFAAAGLTANTSYQFSAIARNGNNVQAATSTVSAATFTLASAPSSVVATVDGQTQITLSWVVADATSSYAENITAGTNSDWISGASFVSSGLTCATAYSFRVKARNGDGTDTAWSATTTATTGACTVANSGSAIPVTVAPPVILPPQTAPAVTPFVPPTPATPIIFIHLLTSGSRGEEVRLLQEKLRQLGYFKYPVNTGFFDGFTKAAVIAFQKAHGLSPVGWVGPGTRAALNAAGSVAESAPAAVTVSPAVIFVHTLGMGSQGAEVKQLQQKLRELGYFTYSTNTGVFGLATKAAVIAFQKAHGLSPVGWVGPGTRAALNSL